MPGTYHFQLYRKSRLLQSLHIFIYFGRQLCHNFLRIFLLSFIIFYEYHDGICLSIGQDNIPAIIHGHHLAMFIDITAIPILAGCLSINSCNLILSASCFTPPLSAPYYSRKLKVPMQAQQRNSQERNDFVSYST